MVVAYLQTIASWMKACFGSWITFHLFCFAVLLKNIKKLEPLYVILSILFPIAISSVPLITESFGPTGEWCWIRKTKCGKRDVAGVVEQIALWYGPMFILLVLQCIAMVTMMVTVYNRAHRKSDENVFGREQHKKVFGQLLPLVAYPVLFCILVTPPLIARVYGFCIINTEWGSSYSLSGHLLTSLEFIFRRDFNRSHRSSKAYRNYAHSAPNGHSEEGYAKNHGGTG